MATKAQWHARYGAPPKGGVLIARVKMYGVWWALYDRRLDRPGWYNVKLMQEGEHRVSKRKICYWFGWRVRENRASRADDWRQLFYNHPGLARWCELRLANWKPKRRTKPTRLSKRSSS